MRILTVYDLLAFCESGQLSRFSSAETGYQICVSVPAVYEKSESQDDYSLKGLVKVMHSGRNRNGSNCTLSGIQKAMKNLAYKPILANFCEIDGVKDFTAHDRIKIEEDKYTYLEHQVGCFTADKPYIEHDDEKDRDYLYAKASIPREYTDAAEIIERKGGTKVSVELDIKEMSYNAKDKELVFEDFEILGCTLLGVDPETGKEVGEGMEGANLSIADFALDENILAKYDIEKLEEFLNKYKKVEEILQKGEDVDGQENTTSIQEEPEVTQEYTTDECTEGTESEPTVTEEVEATENTEVTEETVEAEMSEAESEAETSTEEDTPSEDSNFELIAKFGTKEYTFKRSLRDELYALSTLVNDTYSESDNAWYDVDVYADTKEVVMVDLYSGLAYKQSYKVRGDVYSLTGDRIPVHMRYVTDDEEKKLDEMKASYAEISEKLTKYEEEPKKMDILNSQDYSLVSNMAEFEELKKIDNHFDMSVEEVTAKANELLLNAAKNAAFAQKEPEPKPAKQDTVSFAFMTREPQNDWLDGFVKG